MSITHSFTRFREKVKPHSHRLREGAHLTKEEIADAMEELHEEREVPEGLSIQELYNPRGLCFGCGALNEQGLQLKSFPRDGGIHAEWLPAPHHDDGSGSLSHGVIGALLGCHAAAAISHEVLLNSEFPGKVRDAHSYISSVRIEFHRPVSIANACLLEAKTIRKSKSAVLVQTLLSTIGRLSAEAEVQCHLSEL